MFIIIGSVVVVASVLGGFAWAGGHFHALVHPSEILTIGGASLGAMIIMSPIKVLKDLVAAMISAMKGSPFSKAAYNDLFKLCYELLRLMRRDGLLALEPHLSNPHDSALFNKYPRIAKNHHIVAFLCDGFTPLIEGSADAAKLRELLDAELHIMHEEHHTACHVLQTTADGLPGFGIVAAVLGIVITMGAIDGPVEEIGHKVGAALVGTFLGILASYGFIGPIAARMTMLGESELAYFKTIATIISSCSDSCAPKVVIEQARRGVGTEFRMKREQLEELFKEVEGSAA